MKVPQDTVAELRTVLTGASGALAAFLKPTVKGDAIGFTLDELIAIAKKPG
jgi:hypothetical protein